MDSKCKEKRRTKSEGRGDGKKIIKMCREEGGRGSSFLIKISLS